MEPTTTTKCRQRGCVLYGLWHSVLNPRHRFRTIHTALAAVTVEKATDDDAWTVWLAPHDSDQREALTAPPLPPPGASHEEYMELRAAVLYALRSASEFSNA